MVDVEGAIAKRLRKARTSGQHFTIQGKPAFVVTLDDLSSGILIIDGQVVTIKTHGKVTQWNPSLAANADN